MNDWLQPIQEIAKTNQAQDTKLHSEFKKEFRTVSRTVRRLLKELGQIYWQGTTPRWRIRVERVSACEYWMQPNRFLLMLDKYRNQQGWRVRNTVRDEFFEVLLIHNESGYRYELSHNLTTTDTSEEQLKEALCKMAALGPTTLDDVDGVLH